jgi:hypothetical protein
MAITRVKTSSILQGFPKSRSLLAGNTAFVPPGSYESIATITVGSGGSASIDFTSIPSTYADLQIRYIARYSGGTDVETGNSIKINSSTTGADYYWFQYFYTNGSSRASGADDSFATIWGGSSAGSGASSGVFGVGVIDILEYANTNKTKPVRILTGTDNNGSGALYFSTGLYVPTTAISSISISSLGGNFAQYTKFALYGIKGSA